MRATCACLPATHVNMQVNVSNAFAAYAAAVDLTFTSPTDFKERATVFESTLFEIAEINADAETYYVSRQLVPAAGGRLSA